jgi:hypothetical protein
VGDFKKAVIQTALNMNKQIWKFILTNKSEKLSSAATVYKKMLITSAEIGARMDANVSSLD